MDKENYLKGSKKGRNWQFSLIDKKTVPISPEAYTQPSGVGASSFDTRITALESSLSLLYSKVEFLIEEFAVFQKKSSSASSHTLESKMNQELVLHQLDKLSSQRSSRDKWITVEYLFRKLTNNPADWNIFESTLIKMFDRGSIDLIDGPSSRKLKMRGRKYGLVRIK